MTLRRCLLWGAVFAAGTLAVLFYVLQRPPAAATEILPNQNAYPALVTLESTWARSSRPQKGEGPAEPGQDRQPQLALARQLRETLIQPTRMPLAQVREIYRPTPQSFGATKELFVGLNELAAAELAAGHPTEARKIWEDLLRLAPARFHGGVLLHLLVAVAGEKRTVETIRAHLHKLPAPELKELARTLRQTSSQWEPLPEVLARDLVLGLENYGPWERAAYRASKALTAGLQKIQQHAAKTVTDAAMRRENLLRELESPSETQPAP